jgi:prolyl-tRNA synthetase
LVIHTSQTDIESGRWESTGLELLTVKDRHQRDYVLSPVR